MPAHVDSFEDLDLGDALMSNIRRCKFTKPTPVQKYAIPIGLNGRDMMACAQTGSGKTAAFCFPIIAGLLKAGYQPTGRQRKAFPAALVLAPTRELTSQIYTEATKFSYQSGIRPVVVYGGAPVVNQLRDIERGCDILVATPGRLSDLIERARVSLSCIRYLALDEADRMLDMGFEPQIRRIVEGEDMPPAGHRQTMLFSATFPREIQRLAADFLHDYIFLTVGRVGSSTDLIAQHVEYMQADQKKETVLDCVNTVEGLTLVFVETKRGADQLEDYLLRHNLPATSIHGDKTQAEREMALRAFRSGKCRILVATDVAARGLDIPHVTHVINYDLPKDIDDYVHRIGRTGRAGKKGLATAFFTDEDTGLARALNEVLSETGQEVPGWLANLAARHAPYGQKGRGGGRGRFGGRDFRKDHGGGGGGCEHFCVGGLVMTLRLLCLLLCVCVCESVLHCCFPQRALFSSHPSHLISPPILALIQHKTHHTQTAATAAMAAAAATAAAATVVAAMAAAATAAAAAVTAAAAATAAAATAAAAMAAAATAARAPGTLKTRARMRARTQLAGAFARDDDENEQRTACRAF